MRLLLAFAALIVLCIGCYETKYSLGPRDGGTVNLAYVGDFTSGEGDGRTVIAIRNVDNKSYYVQWTEVEKADKRDKPVRFVGFTADVKGAIFAHLRPLTDDGTIAEKHLVARVSLSDDNNVLTIRNLHEDFFKDKSIDSDQAFRRVVEQNLEDASMYDDADGIKAVRVPAEK